MFYAKSTFRAAATLPKLRIPKTSRKCIYITRKPSHKPFGAISLTNKLTKKNHVKIVLLAKTVESYTITLFWTMKTTSETATRDEAGKPHWFGGIQWKNNMKNDNNTNTKKHRIGKPQKFNSIRWY